MAAIPFGHHPVAPAARHLTSYAWAPVPDTLCAKVQVLGRKHNFIGRSLIQTKGHNRAWSASPALTLSSELLSSWYECTLSGHRLDSERIQKPPVVRHESRRLSSSRLDVRMYHDKLQSASLIVSCLFWTKDEKEGKRRKEGLMGEKLHSHGIETSIICPNSGEWLSESQFLWISLKFPTWYRVESRGGKLTERKKEEGERGKKKEEKRQKGIILILDSSIYWLHFWTFSRALMPGYGKRYLDVWEKKWMRRPVAGCKDEEEEGGERKRGKVDGEKQQQSHSLIPLFSSFSHTSISCLIFRSDISHTQNHPKIFLP